MLVYGEGGNDTIIQNGSGTQLFDGGEGVDTYLLDLENWPLHLQTISLVKSTLLLISQGSTSITIT